MSKNHWNTKQVIEASKLFSTTFQLPSPSLLDKWVKNSRSANNLTPIVLSVHCQARFVRPTKQPQNSHLIFISSSSSIPYTAGSTTYVRPRWLKGSCQGLGLNKSLPIQILRWSSLFKSQPSLQRLHNLTLLRSSWPSGTPHPPTFLLSSPIPKCMLYVP